MFKLYARPGAGSAAVEALLALLGATYEIVNVEKTDEGYAPSWFLKINGRGEVPALQLGDDSIMTESAAMMIYLADLFPEKAMAPAVGTAARAQYLRWMIYMAASPYTADLRMYYSERFSVDRGHATAIKQKAIIDLNRDFDVFAAQLGDGPFILGSHLSAVDIYAAMLLSWSEDAPALFVRQPKLKRLYEAVADVPALATVWARNEIPLRF